jgi:predicted nuclease with TOPRIM domain
MSVPRRKVSTGDLQKLRNSHLETELQERETRIAELEGENKRLKEAYNLRGKKLLDFKAKIGELFDGKYLITREWVADFEKLLEEIILLE